jgi:hypothetical protein
MSDGDLDNVDYVSDGDLDNVDYISEIEDLDDVNYSSFDENEETLPPEGDTDKVTAIERPTRFVGRTRSYIPSEPEKQIVFQSLAVFTDVISEIPCLHAIQRGNIQRGTTWGYKGRSYKHLHATAGADGLQIHVRSVINVWERISVAHLPPFLYILTAGCYFRKCIFINIRLRMGPLAIVLGCGYLATSCWMKAFPPSSIYPRAT